MVAEKRVFDLSSQGANLAKLFATIFVVFVHSFNIFTFSGVEQPTILRGVKAIVSVAVPIFFFLSGYYLLYKKTFVYKSNLKKKITSLIVPYILFILLYTLCNIAGFHAAPSMFDNYLAFNLVDWAKHLVGIPFWGYPLYYEPLWFLRDLVLLNLLSFIIVPIVKRAPIYVIVPLMVLLQLQPLPSNLRYSVVFFVLGAFFGNRSEFPILKMKWSILIFVAAFITSICLPYNVVSRFLIFPMAYSIICMAEHISKTKRISLLIPLLMPFSFITYLTHQHPLTLIQKMIAPMMSTSSTVLVFFLLPFIIIALCCGFAIFCRKVIPRTYGVLVGNRG